MTCSRPVTLHIGLLVAAASVLAPPARAQSCTPVTRPYFLFQVDRRAVYIPDSTQSPHPAAPRLSRVDTEAALVQFVVDSLGVPQPASFKVLAARDPAMAEAARALLPRWRFRPARLGACRVPQLVQTPLDP